MQNPTRMCSCRLCGDQGELVTQTTYHTHQHRHRLAQQQQQSEESRRKRPRHGLTQAERYQRLRSMLDTFTQQQSTSFPPPASSFDCAQAGELDFNDDYLNEPEGAPEGNDEEEEEHCIAFNNGEEDQEEEEVCMDGNGFDFEEEYLDRGLSVESELLFTQDQRRRDSWVTKVYLLVQFMMAYTSLSRECAVLFLTFVFRVLAPLIDPDHNVDPQQSSLRQRGLLVTPSSVAKSLGLRESYSRYLVCTNDTCSRLNLWDGRVPFNRTLLCQHCGHQTMTDGKPALEYAHRFIETTLASLLQDERMEDALDEWKAAPPQPQEDQRYGEIWTGEAWRQDCTHFECPTPCRFKHTAFVDDGDLNLKITLNVDWFGPHKGRHVGYHSIGAILMRIDNLPERFSTLDRRCFGIHLIGLLPGPKEASKKPFMRYLQLVVDELIDLDRNGRLISTARHPEGKLSSSRYKGSLWITFANLSSWSIDVCIAL